MNISVEQALSDLQRQYLGHVSMMMYDYSKFCVKGDPTALLIIEMEDDGALRKIEELATVVPHMKEGDDDKIDLYPQGGDDVMALLAKGVMEYYPEFKQSVENVGGDRFLRLTMPEVDDDRKDLLDDGVKMVHDATVTKMDAAYAKCTAVVAENMKGESAEEAEELKEVKKAMDDLKKQYEDMREQYTSEKNDEVENANKLYHERHPEADGTAEAESWSGKACQSLKME